MPKKYTYRDNTKGSYKGGVWFGEVVFECMANGILEADKFFEAADIQIEVKRKDKSVLVSSKNGVTAFPFIGCSSQAMTYEDIRQAEKAKRLKDLDETLARVAREANTYPRPWDQPKNAEKRADSGVAWAIIGLHASYEHDAKYLKRYFDQVELGHAKAAQDKADALKELMKIIIRGE